MDTSNKPDVDIARQCLTLTEGYTQGAARDRIVQAFYAGVASCAPDRLSAAEVMAVALGGHAVVEKWAGIPPSHSNGH